ncbi:hypothetical protein M1D58_16010 [Pseudomonas sp. R4-76]|uniref:hypothetical protein n=1 Tax=unclassified Pseudomonas TaxID=196821 RepID=UPI003DA88A2D
MFKLFAGLAKAHPAYTYLSLGTEQGGYLFWPGDAQLAGWFNQFLEAIRTLIQRIGQAAGQIHSSSGSATEVSAEMAEVASRPIDTSARFMVMRSWSRVWRIRPVRMRRI